MSTVLFFALSVNKEVLDDLFIKSYQQWIKTSKYYNSDKVKAVVVTQGFDHDPADDITIVRDDTFVGSSKAISDIRNYLTDKHALIYHTDYIYFCDDDFKFRSESMRSVYQDMTYMDNNLFVGMTNLHIRKGGPPDIDEEEFPYYDYNPSQVSTRSGILVKTKAYDTYNMWGDDVRYFEECVLATKIYLKGYSVVHSYSDVVHRTKTTGLGRSQEIQYGKNFIPRNGRRVLVDQGILISPSVVEKDGVEYPRVDLPLKLSESAEEEHSRNRKNLYNQYRR